MKRKSLLFLLFLALGLPWAANAQETLTVCDGTTTNGKIPVNGLYVDTQGTTSEFIIPATTEGMSDMEGGTVSKLTFYVPNPPATWGSPTIQLYIGEVDYTTLSTLNGPTNFTVVATGVWDNTQTTIEVEFATPYTYEGGNLLIGTYVQAKSSTYKTTNFAGVSAESGSSRYNNGSGSGTAQSFLPKTTFTYTPGGGSFCEKPATMEAFNVTSNSAVLSWTGGSGTYNLEYKLTSAEDWTRLLTNTSATTYTLQDLNSDKAYQARVQSVCGEDVSGWKSVNFRTSFAIPLIEEFGTSIPTGWAMYTGLLENVMAGTAELTSTTNGWNFGESNGVFDNHAYVNIYGSNCQKWLVLPTITMEDSIQLQFDMALTAYNPNISEPSFTGIDDKFIVLINVGSNWTILRQWDNAGSEYVYNDIASTPTGQTVSIDLSSYAEQQVAVAFYGESTVGNADNNLHIDNVSITRVNATDMYIVTVSANPADGGMVSGGGEFAYGQTCTLTATPAEGYSFVNWTKDDVEVSTEPTYSFIVTEDAAYVANFTENQGSGIQISNFAQGYNWWSTNLDITLNDLKAALVEALPGSTNISIIGENYAINYNGRYWQGSLSVMDVAEMYKIVTPSDCMITLEGPPLNPAEHPITISNDLNWIGYPLSTEMSLEEAFSGFSSAYDVIISQECFAFYHPTTGWCGTLKTLEPGMGLLYKSLYSGDRTFIYPDGPAVMPTEDNITATNNHWVSNLCQYSNNMNIVGMVVLNGVELQSDQYEIGAFVGDECRGSSKPIYVEALDRYIVFLTLTGNVNDEVTFKLYNYATGEEIDESLTNLTFNATVVGLPIDDLYVFDFTSENTEYTVTVMTNPVEGGTVEGSGTYADGETCTLTATPNEGYSFVNWTENDEVVSTENPYTFTITGNRNLVANFIYNGGGGSHEYVDLGLPSGLLWATCNVGANAPEDYGDYFAWGETQPKDYYDWSTYQYCMGSYNTLTKYCSNSSYGYNGFTDSLTTLLPEDDAATANWGGDWRMPTKAEFQELLDNTTAIWTTQNGVDGRLFTASNGNSLFLPAAGYLYEGGFGDADWGYYWLSLLNTNVPKNAWELETQSQEFHGLGTWDRYCGQPVRPVRFGQNTSFIIDATANPTEGGTVEGAGTYTEGATCTLTAMPAVGYYFVNWTQNGAVVSTTATYSFVVEANVDLVANFAEGIYIGDGGDATNTYLPSFSYYNYSLTQQIYTAEEIGMAGTIHSIAFKNTGAEKTRTYNVYMLLTDKDAFESGADWVAMSENDMVFGGELTFAVGEWTTITLDTPFNYDGISNLIVGVSDVTGTYSNSPHMACLVFEATSQAIRAYRDNSPYDITAPGVNGTVLDEKNQIVLNMSSGSFCEKPSAFVADDIQANQVHLTWEGGSGNYNLEYKEAFGGEWNTIAIIGTELWLTGLDADTDYNARIQSVCEDGSVSGWKTLNFTTPWDCPDGMVCIGSGTATSTFLPSYNFYNYSLTQQIYTAEEIGTSGMITSIAFFNGGAEKTRTYDFYMKHTTKSNFSSSTDWIAVSSSDLVFSGSVTMVADDWTIITFDTPFVYNGTSNVVLVADDNTGDHTSSPHMACRVFDADGNQAIYKYADGTDYDPYNPSGYSGTRLTVKNQVILGMGSGSGSYIVSVTANPTEGGTVTGAGTYPGGSLCTLTATANDGYTFVNWTKDNVEVSTEATYSFTVTEDAAYVANFVPDQGEETQETSLAQGWNWWSTYVEQEGIDGLGMLEEGLGDNGITIRSQVGYTDYYAGYGWYGSLSSVNNESSYKIKTDAPCAVAMTGVAAVPSQHPVTLNQGWTWMGYVSSTAMDVNEALSGLEATVGDKLKSQEGYADYYANYGWYGSLNTIEPGMGLMYYSANGEAVTFTYPEGSKGRELKRNLTAENNHWVPNVYAYPDNMTVMAVVELNDTELTSDNYELAAFANGECRGSVRLTYAEPLNRHVAFLTISGKDAAELSFRLYNTETNAEYYDAEESLDFVADAMVGADDDLYVVHFRGTTGMDELASKVKVYPNPVASDERFSIVMNTESKTPVRVEIVNALGVETLRATSVQTPVSMVAPNTAGVYTLRITVEGKGTVVRKLVVK